MEVKEEVEEGEGGEEEGGEKRMGEKEEEEEATQPSVSAQRARLRGATRGGVVERARRSKYTMRLSLSLDGREHPPPARPRATNRQTHARRKSDHDNERASERARSRSSASAAFVSFAPSRRFSTATISLCRTAQAASGAQSLTPRACPRRQHGLVFRCIVSRSFRVQVGR